MKWSGCAVHKIGKTRTLNQGATVVSADMFIKDADVLHVTQCTILVLLKYLI